MNERAYFDEMKTLNAYPVLGCISYLLGIIAIGVVLMMLTSCKTQYVPVETVRVEHTHSTDTIERTNTVTNNKETVIREASKADSALLAAYGIRLKDNERLLLFLQKELEREKGKEVEHRTDTVIKVDSIQVPYPVEKKLGAWEQVKIGSVGFVAATVIVAVLLLIRWLRRRYKRA